MSRQTHQRANALPRATYIRTHRGTGAVPRAAKAGYTSFERNNKHKFTNRPQRLTTATGSPHQLHPMPLAGMRKLTSRHTRRENPISVLNVHSGRTLAYTFQRKVRTL
eukprot:4396346-Prymnesium_polylepis.2